MENFLMNTNIHRIALFTIAVGKDRHYFDSVRKFLPYNKEYFGQDYPVDFILFTDRDEMIDGFRHIPCETTAWPYTALLKNNIITDYLNQMNKWEEYSHIFYIDADSAIGDKYEFFSHQFLCIEMFWGKGGYLGSFYGGMTEYFKKLALPFYDEIKFIYNNKLPVPRGMDEFYLNLFCKQNKDDIHVIKLMKDTNILFFFDNENLEDIIRQKGKYNFLFPLKSKGRANSTELINYNNQKIECTINLSENYIFNNYTFDFGRLLKIDDSFYRILWSKHPEARDVLNIETHKISKQPAGKDTLQMSPVLSIVMPVYNVPPEFLNESIESILNQTFGDFELLIIDDGSTETEGIDLIRSYQDSRIHLITNPHNFIDSLNRGIAESKGKYIARMDADDIMLPKRLQTQYDFMENHPEIDICGSWMETFGNRTDTVRGPTDHKEIVSSLLLYNTLSHPTVILRKSSVCKCGTNLYKENYACAEDYKLWTDLALKGLNFAIVPEALLKYRSSEKQVSNTRQEEMFQSTVRIQMEYAEQVMEQILVKSPQYEILFNDLITLFNDGKMDYTLLLETIHGFYNESFS